MNSFTEKLIGLLLMASPILLFFILDMVGLPLDENITSCFQLGLVLFIGAISAVLFFTGIYWFVFRQEW